MTDRLFLNLMSKDVASTQPSHIAVLWRFPIELLDNIAGHAPLSDILTLSRTSKTLHGVCTRAIYREISIDSPVGIVKCCRTLINCQQAALTVRTITITSHASRYVYFGVRVKKAFFTLKFIYQIRAIWLLPPHCIGFESDALGGRIAHLGLASSTACSYSPLNTSPVLAQLRLCTARYQRLRSCELSNAPSHPCQRIDLYMEV